MQNANFFLKITAMEIILSRGSVYPDQVVPLLKKSAKYVVSATTVTEAINQLVKEKLLQYQSDGSVTCHSRLVLNYNMEKYVPDMCHKLL